MDRSVTYDFLLVIHGDHGRDSCRFLDKRSKRNVSHLCVFNAPTKGVPIGSLWAKKKLE